MLPRRSVKSAAGIIHGSVAIVCCHCPMRGATVNEQDSKFAFSPSCYVVSVSHGERCTDYACLLSPERSYISFLGARRRTNLRGRLKSWDTCSSLGSPVVLIAGQASVRPCIILCHHGPRRILQTFAVLSFSSTERASLETCSEHATAMV